MIHLVMTNHVKERARVRLGWSETELYAQFKKSFTPDTIPEGKNKILDHHGEWVIDRSGEHICVVTLMPLYPSRLAQYVDIPEPPPHKRNRTKRIWKRK